VFDAAPCPLPPMVQPVNAEQSDTTPMLQADRNSESDDEALEAPEEQHGLVQQPGQPQLEHVEHVAHATAQQPEQLAQQQHAGGLKGSACAQRAPVGINPEPMTYREQAAEQQGRAQTAS
jgi:hypothetical protein